MNPLTALPGWMVAFLVPLLLLCLACLIWAILPRRAPSSRRDAAIERQIATLRKGADHSVTHRPRVRANGCSQPAPTHIKAAPKNTPPSGIQAPAAVKFISVPAPKPCGGGLCRHRADCADHHCPGRQAATLAGARDHAHH